MDLTSGSSTFMGSNNSAGRTKTMTPATAVMSPHQPSLVLQVKFWDSVYRQLLFRVNRIQDWLDTSLHGLAC